VPCTLAWCALLAVCRMFDGACHQHSRDRVKVL
jgi:hypothetical protein